MPNKTVDLFFRMIFDVREFLYRLNFVLNDVIQEHEIDHALKFYSNVVGTKNLNICPNMFSLILIVYSHIEH